MSERNPGLSPNIADGRELSTPVPPLSREGTTEPIVAAGQTVVVDGGLNMAKAQALNYFQLVPAKPSLLRAGVLYRNLKSRRVFGL